MLRISLLGHLGADPESRYSQKGAPITQFRVAVNQVRTGRDGEREERSEWFQVRAMGQIGERAGRLAKGNRVLVVGRLTVSHFQSREGEPRVGFDVWADEVTNVSGRPAPDRAGEEDTVAPADPAGRAIDELEDLPF